MFSAKCVLTVLRKWQAEIAMQHVDMLPNIYGINKQVSGYNFQPYIR